MTILRKLKPLPNYSVTKKRSPVAKGEKHASAKLTNQDIIDIRASTESAMALATKYGVSKSHILNVLAFRVRATM
jgi:hypothetical protein